jgi:hypothetical protein
MDESSIQKQIAEQQRLILAILGIVYQSEYPITLETIADNVEDVSTDKLFNIVTDLVSAGSLQVHMSDGNAKYHKPNRVRGPFPPLPFFHFLVYFTSPQLVHSAIQLLIK